MNLYVIAYIDDDGVAHGWSPCGQPLVPTDPYCTSVQIVNSLLQPIQLLSGVTMITEVIDEEVTQTETLNCSEETFYLLDEDGNILTDENNNRLTWK